MSKGTAPRYNTESYLQSRRPKLPAGCIETLSISLSREMTRQSEAIWFAPLGAVRADLAAGILARLAIPTEGTEEPVGLLHRSERIPSATVLAFMGLLREMAGTRRSGPI
jgi:DNA-binding transcriptional LysR family regulator